MNTIISTLKAPKAVGPYSQAVLSGNLLFVSGQMPLDPVSGIIVGSTIREQTIRVLENMREIILEAGFPFSSIVKCTCFLQNMNDFAAFNDEYAKYFSEFAPARECVEVVKLPKGAFVEISAICAK